eukprot:9492468-Pyramimonas_sp.AAC.1
MSRGSWPGQLRGALSGGPTPQAAGAPPSGPVPHTFVNTNLSPQTRLCFSAWLLMALAALLTAEGIATSTAA